MVLHVCYKNVHSYIILRLDNNNFDGESAIVLAEGLKYCQFLKHCRFWETELELLMQQVRL